MKKFKFIAELCQNHLGSFQNVKRMTEECAKNGADIIKLQYILSNDLSFRPIFEAGYTKNKKIYSIKRPYSDELKRLKKLELKDNDLIKFIKLCKNLRVEPAITCFTIKDVKKLNKLGFKTVKIASYDCASFQLLREIKKYFTNIIVSTGATYDDEIAKAAQILSDRNFSFLHCVTIYPTPLNELHLSRMRYLKKHNNKVGFSDHSYSRDKNKNLASFLAIYNGAELIERHVTMFEKNVTKDGAVSIYPSDIKILKEFTGKSKTEQKKYLLKNFNFSFSKALGNYKRNLSRVELLNRDYYRGRFCTKKNSRQIFNWEEV
jgi:sialic acid synthase SpsE